VGSDKSVFLTGSLGNFHTAKFENYHRNRKVAGFSTAKEYGYILWKRPGSYRCLGKSKKPF
jgi:hypothetical protein